AELVEQAPELDSRAAQKLAEGALADYQEDARALPLEILAEALSRLGLRPDLLAQELGVEIHQMLRRLAALPEERLGRPAGLVVCDASGAILFRKAVSGFSLPRFGASCPLWPLFAALSQPGVPIQRLMHQQGRAARDSQCFAVSWAAQAKRFDADPVMRSIMLILPAPQPEAQPAETSRPVGASCRICMRRGCEARREPSILRDASAAAMAPM
ncbi:short-chain fatty acyl-CoA regulator family protein, partial [Phaeobacter sp. HF9A]|uniref:short-chain fatty acyl-CoA regulator family protein n=1 Tax=Phaeobacter sp. HF9A TaxID=2721561 RepID=UPI0014310BBA